jgi:hypothetical protein
MNQYYKNCLTILNRCIKQEISIPESCKKSGRSTDYVSTFCRRIEERVKNNSVTKEEADKIVKLYEELKGHKFSKSKKIKNNKNLSITDKLALENESLTEEEIEELNYDAYNDEKYDERSFSEIIRDENKKVSSYHYKIFIRDEKSLEGYFTREEMDLVYRLYSNMDGAGMTLRGVSRYFSNLTFRDFKRILRAFNITKSSIPVAPHIIEESTEEEVMDIIFRNKENNILKKLEDERGRYVEKNLKDAHKLIIEYKNNEEWIESIVSRYIDQTDKKTLITNIQKGKINKKDNKNTGKPLICFFGDIHYGKKYNNPIYGRGYNKEIAHERILEIKNKILEQYNQYNSREIVLVNLGDLVESVLEDGMHPNHTAEMDLFQEEQIFYAIDSLKVLLSEIHNNTNCPIEFYSIHGNHDRVGVGRDEDKSRTAGKVISHVLKRELENERLKFFIPKNNLCKIVKDNICIFVQHGDSSLSKKKPSELVNLYGEPGCFTILVQGHWHSLKVEEGTNFIALKVPSVASSDKFILEELGNNNLPGFITGKQPEVGYGFDYNKITLY